MADLPTRETLLMRLRCKRDDLSWEEFIGVYERYIYLLIRGMNVGHHDAEDLVQVALLAIWQKIPEFEYEPNRARFRTWLCRITRNKVIDYIRSSTSESRKKNGFEAESVSLPDIEAIAEKEWKAHVTDRAWSNIQNEFSETVLQSFKQFNEGRSVEAISAELDISESSIYVYSKRVRERLVKEIRRLDVEWN